MTTDAGRAPGLIAASLMLASASGPTVARAALGLDYIATMDGQCSRLLVGGKDASKACGPKVLNTVYKTGRVAFTFVAGDLATVTFGGMGQQQVKDSADVASQPLDNVVFTLIGTGTAPNKVKAAGVCTYSNPYVGPSRITCSAHTAQGVFAGSFVSNGRTPSMQRF